MSESSIYFKLKRSHLLNNEVFLKLRYNFPLEQSVDDFDLRKLEHIFPGFSYGYRRAGLCYGCEKGAGPQYVLLNSLQMTIEICI